MSIPTTISESTRRLNPQLFGLAAKRIRQKQTPALNKTEQRAKDWLENRGIHTAPHLLTFRLANGCKYTPDLCHVAADTGKIICYEVKGPVMRDDSVVKLKCAAEIFQGSIRFILLWEDRPGGRWNSQVVL